ncbi:MAG: sulfatase [Bacteroidota bacterium]
MLKPVPRGTLSFAGMVAGAAVGLADGLWGAVDAGADVRGALLAALLVASVDAGLAAGTGAGVEGLARMGAWGRRRRPARWARVLAVIAVGAAGAAVTIAVVAALLERRNRFLAGGLAAVVSCAVGVVGAALAPALARVFSCSPFGSQVRPAGAGGSTPALLLLAPLATVAVGVVVAWSTRGLPAPLGAAPAVRRLALAGGAAGLLPALLIGAAKLRAPRVRLRWALPIAVVVHGGALAVFAAANWANHLRFVGWAHVIPAVAIVALATAIAPVIAGRLPASVGRRLVAGCAAALILMATVLATSESEIARKVAATRAGLAGPVLAQARRIADRDRDGYPRLFGGGDCDDGDPSIQPGVLDLPDDGIDQDCDGSDASVSVLAPAPFAPVPDAVPRDLNLILVTIDTVRADHLGCYGYARPTSPAIDRLAAESGVFVNGWAHAPSTRYSMPAIATGRWPTAIAWDESIWWPRIGPGVRTIAEALKARGYRTAAFYSYDYFSTADRRGFERGVDEYRADRAALHQAVNGPMESHGSSSREMADDAIAFLEAHRDRKFFLWVHFYDPHLSYEPHAEVPSFGKARVDLYDGEIRFTDLHFGRLLERLRSLGLWNNTAVVVTGDHGEGFGEHGVTEHGFDLYAAQTKVPLIVRVPGLPPRRITAPAGHVDLAPTLLNLARAPQEGAFLGRSLVPDLAGIADTPPPMVFQEVTSERGKKRGLVNRDFHLIWNWTPENTTECYDRRADPDERRDLWGRATDAPCRLMKAELQRLVSALSVPADVARKLKASVFAAGAPFPAPAVAVDALLGDQVKVIGYTVTPGDTAPGGAVDLTIAFESQRAIPAGWRFFFHLMGPGGAFRNLDHIPVDGAMPLERWRPGQRIVDGLRITFPPGTPRGAYRVIMGLFRGADRLPISPPSLSDGNKALRLATIQVR